MKRGPKPKPIDQVMIARIVYMLPADWLRVKSIGNGNYSRGLRTTLSKFKEKPTEFD